MYVDAIIPLTVFCPMLLVLGEPRGAQGTLCRFNGKPVAGNPHFLRARVLVARPLGPGPRPFLLAELSEVELAGGAHDLPGRARLLVAERPAQIREGVVQVVGHQCPDCPARDDQRSRMSFGDRVGWQRPYRSRRASGSNQQQDARVIRAGLLLRVEVKIGRAQARRQILARRNRAERIHGLVRREEGLHARPISVVRTDFASTPAIVGGRLTRRDRRPLCPAGSLRRRSSRARPAPSASTPRGESARAVHVG